MSESIMSVAEQEFTSVQEGESPFLCNFCEDIKIAAGGEFDMQSELDVCQRCVRIDRSVRFADYLIIQ